MTTTIARTYNIFSVPMIRGAIISALTKLTPSHQVKNPVMFVVYLGALITLVIGSMDLLGQIFHHADVGHRLSGGAGVFTIFVSLWLWMTLIFSNFAESIAEGRGKAQADSLRQSRCRVKAKQLSSSAAKLSDSANYTEVEADRLVAGDLVFVEAGDIVPGDGEIVEGVASVDESAITGESAPVIRESGGDRSSVTGGTKVLSDWVIVRITNRPGESFLDRMISLVEGSKRQKTPNEIALSILLASLTILFTLVCITLLPLSGYSVRAAGAGEVITIPVLIALLVCLAPTTIGGLISAIGVAGMDRLLQRNVIATSGRAVEAAGDIDVLLLDKTGTITLGNRQAVAFYPVAGVSEAMLAEAADLASLADETPEGRSIVVLAKERFGLRAFDMQALSANFIPFSAQTRISGVDITDSRGGHRQIRKGAGEAIQKLCSEANHNFSSELQTLIATVAREGATPLVVSENGNPLGVVELKDIVKGGIKERFAELRLMGIKTIMITGDNALTAAAIAAEAGVDDFLSDATPEAKLSLIRKYQTGGRLVAMTGDGTNDAPALAQADVAVAMNSGTQAAKEAGNMIDLDSNPTKLIEIVEIGKQLLMTRGALTTFSLSNDVAKYFAIVPAAFAPIYPQLKCLDVMHLSSPSSAIMSAVIFNAVVIVALVPLALRGVKYRKIGAAAILRDNLVVYGLGGLIVPFIGIKVIDVGIDVGATFISKIMPI